MGKLTQSEIKKLQKMVQPDGIQVVKSYTHSKLNQKIVNTIFVQDDGFTFETFVPYIDMNKGVNNLDLESIAQYLRSIKMYFTKQWIDTWKSE